MKIRIRENDRSFQIALPTNLIFSRFMLRFVLKTASSNGRGLPGLSPEAMDRLAGEIRHIKKKHGSWTLVEVESAGGEQVTITL